MVGKALVAIFVVLALGSCAGTGSAPPRPAAVSDPAAESARAVAPISAPPPAEPTRAAAAPAPPAAGPAISSAAPSPPAAGPVIAAAPAFDAPTEARAASEEPAAVAEVRPVEAMRAGAPEASAPEPAFLPVERAFLARVSETRLRERVKRLVGFGARMGGTPSGRAASDWIAAEFRAAGLEIETVQDPPLLAHQEKWALSVRIGGEDPVPLADGCLFAFSPSARRERVPVVAVGSAAELDDPARSSAVLGAAILVPEAAFFADRRAFYERAAPLSPAAILVAVEPIDGRDDFTQVGRLRPGERPQPIPAFTLSAREGKRVRAGLAEAKPVSVDFAAETWIGRESPRTVIATLPGRDRGRFLLVCAHGDADSGGPGADDNASGESVVMEVAAALAALRGEGALPEPGVSLRFAIWGAEIHSTGAFVTRLGAEGLRDVVGVLNYDQSGAGEERDAIYFEPNDLPHHAPWVRAFHEIAAAGLARGDLWPAYTTNPSLGGTDSYVFGPNSLARRGLEAAIPSFTLFTAAFGKPSIVPQTPGFESPGWKEPGPVFVDYCRYYHSTGDTPERTTEREPRNLVWGASAGGALLLRLLEERPWDAAPPETGS